MDRLTLGAFPNLERALTQDGELSPDAVEHELAAYLAEFIRRNAQEIEEELGRVRPPQVSDAGSQTK